MIQYPKNTHLTLPSVVGGFGTQNILRDPPKAIYTRYKPKVGETQHITEYIDGSGDRICEAIKPYARGVNPFASVNYGNYGTQGGQMRDAGGQQGQQRQGIVGGQSYLPYRVNREGAFRPPLIPLEERLPLSRLPRLPTVNQTNPGSAQITVDNGTRCNSNLRAIRNELLEVCAPPRASFNIQTDQGKPVKIESMIVQDKLRAMAHSNKTAKSYTLGVNTNPERGIKTDKNTLYASVPTNLSRNIQTVQLPQYVGGNVRMPIRDSLTSVCRTNPNRVGGKNAYLHKNIQLDRNRPLASMMVNPSSKAVDLNAGVMSRSVKLAPRTPRGGFSNSGGKTNTARQELQPKLVRTKISRKAQQLRDSRQ